MSPAMKKILLTNFHPQRDGGGGHTRYIQTILESDLRKDFEFGVAAPEESAVWAMGRALNAPTFACAFPGHAKEIPQMIGAVRRFERIYREWAPDLVHLNGSRDQGIVVLWKTLYGRPVRCVRTHHAVRNIPDTAYNRWAYGTKVEGHIYVGHSARNVSWAGHSLVVPNARVIPNGVDVSFWSPRPKDPRYLARLGLAPTDFVFGSHAGMSAHKRTDLFLRAAARQLARGARPFRILLRGNEQQIGEHRRLAAELGLDNVVYVGHEPDPRGYLSVLDVGFLLSESIEAISFAARELMAMGKPLISSDYAGLVENVDDGLNGRLVECGDVDGVAEAIGWFLDLDAQALGQVSRNARQKAEHVFSVQKQIRGLRRFYGAHVLGLSTSSV
jgi:glycosyltransferase involved in cell wall biosynthesis